MLPAGRQVDIGKIALGHAIKALMRCFGIWGGSDTQEIASRLTMPALRRSLSP